MRRETKRAYHLITVRVDVSGYPSRLHVIDLQRNNTSKGQGIAGGDTQRKRLHGQIHLFCTGLEEEEE